MKKMTTRRTHAQKLHDTVAAVREEAVRLEQQRIDFERRAHLARQNLYGVARKDAGRGWIDNTRR